MMKEKNNSEKLEVAVWDTCSKYGKGLLIAGVYCGLDAITQKLTGNHIHEHLGLNIPDPNQIIEKVRTGISVLNIVYGTYKIWLEDKMFPEEYYENYKHLAKNINP